MENFKFLSDEAVLDSANDRLKHPSIAETLKTIVINSPLPFTIGLFGRWGAGKSSISNFLKEKLNTKENKVPVILFDVWKYENDSLRRQFLLELVKQLKEQSSLEKKFKIDTRVTSSISKNFQGATTIDKGKLFQLILLLGAVFVAVGACFFVINPTSAPSYLASTLTSIIGIIGLATIIQYTTQVVTTETGTISNDKFSDPDEFEEEFAKIVTASKPKRIVIIFDNLDRVTHDKAIELLSTIKTFLEPKAKKCIFLVPCDEYAIKVYLESVYTQPGIENTFDADEFLRKFFNTFIRIPDFINADLEGYTKEQLTNTRLEEFRNNTDLITVITQAFRDNPRQIKQFINTLLSHYLLAYEREKGRNAIIKPSGTITKNSAFLAKILIIKQKWPKFYKQISTDPSTFSSPEDIEENKGLSIFLSGTSITTTTNLRAFIYLKQPSSKLAIAGIESENLEIAFKDNNGEDAKKIIKAINNDESEHIKLLEFIKILLSENTTSKQALVNIINVTEITLKEMGIKLIGNRDFAEVISATVSSELLEVLHTLSQEFIFTCLAESREEKIKEIVARYIWLLANAKDAKALMSETDLINLSNNIHQFPLIFQKNTQEVTSALATGAFDSPSILGIFFQSGETIKKYIDSGLMVKLIQSITVNDFAQKNSISNLYQQKMNLILNTNMEMNKSLMKEAIGKSTELITLLQATQTPENVASLTEVLINTEKLITQDKDLIEVTEADNLVAVINDTLSRIPGQLERTPFIPLLIFIRDIVSEPNKGLIDTIVVQYGQHGNLEHYKSFIAPRDKETASLLLAPIKNHIESLGRSDIAFLEFIWEYEDEDERSRIIQDLINRDSIKYALQLIEKDGYKVKEEKQIVQSLLTKAVSVLPDTKDLIFATLEKMDFAKDEDFKQQFNNQIEQLLLTTDNPSLILGNKYYSQTLKHFPKPSTVHLLENLIDWLVKETSITQNHRIQIQIVLMNWSDVPQAYQEKFLKHLFEQLSKEALMVDDIKMITQQIEDAKISKTAVKEHISGIKNRIDIEENPEIKTTLETFYKKYK